MSHLYIFLKEKNLVKLIHDRGSLTRVSCIAGFFSVLEINGLQVASDVFDDIYRCSFKRQTGVSLKYMMDFGSIPTKRNLLLSAQFLHKELPIRLAHRVTELENLPLGLSHKPPILKVCPTTGSSWADFQTIGMKVALK